MIFTISSKHIYQSKENRVNIQPKFFTFSHEGAGGNKSATLRIRQNATLGGGTTFVDESTNTSVVAKDSASSTATGGVVIGGFEFGKVVNSFVLNAKDITVPLPPGTKLTFSVALDTGTSDAGAGVNWDEEF